MNIVYTDELSHTLYQLKRRDCALFRQVQRKISQIALLDEAVIIFDRLLHHDDAY